MDLTVLMALAAAMLNTGNDLVYRNVSNKSKKDTLFFYGMASFVSLVVLFLWMLLARHSIRFDLTNIGFGLLIGVVSFFTYTTYLSSFSKASTSSVVTIFRLNSIPSILLGIVFLNDTISLRKGIAILMCIGCVLLFKEKENSQLRPQGRGVLLAVIACLFSSVLNFINKLAMKNGGDNMSVVFFRFATVTLIVIVMVLIRYRKELSWFGRSEIKKPLFSGLFLVLSILVAMEALKAGNISVVMPVINISFIFIALISKIFFKEKISPRKWIGIVIAIAAIFLIS